MAVGYSEFLAVVAAGDPAREVGYEHQKTVLQKNANVLAHRLINGVEPMIISGTAKGSSDAGLLVWQALASKPENRKGQFRETAFLDVQFNIEKLNEYLRSEVPEWLQALVLVAPSGVTSRLVSLAYTNRRGPGMELRNCVVWASDRTGNVSFVNGGSLSNW